MPDITVNEERLPRYSVDEYGVVSVQVATILTMTSGRTLEYMWRVVITPDDDVDSVNLEGIGPPPQPLKDAVAAARYPAAVARWEARKAATPDGP
jgi:hypothetical protein